MNNQAIQQLPKLKNIKKNLINDRAVNLKVEHGVVIFRASKEMQSRIEELLEKNKSGSLKAEEESELTTYEEIDDYLSYVNRLIRNSTEDSGVKLAA